MLTQSATAARHYGPPSPRVTTVSRLLAHGVSRSQVRAAIDADRWQRIGVAVVRHRGVLTETERLQVALINCGPRSALTGLTAAQIHGLRGWPSDEVHVLVPPGAALSAPASRLGVRLHRRRGEFRHELVLGRRIHQMAPALVLATDAMRHPRSACGLLAAAVQQNMVTPGELQKALADATRTRHRALLLRTVEDIAMGADALSEIDFVHLCRRHGLPPPRQQAVRTDIHGNRRYLDALWDRVDGTVIGVEVDGALHMVASRWWADQIRLNEIVLGGVTVLRFPSTVVRAEPDLVADQLRRALNFPPKRRQV